jgi:hypothetical protein
MQQGQWSRRGAKTHNSKAKVLTTTNCCVASPRHSYLGQPHTEVHGRPISAPKPSNPEGNGLGATRCETPRQTCPRPNGFGRNLRSKTRWFTGFCNSHQVSHFATFFIDARAEISVAESRLVLCKMAMPFGTRERGFRTSSLCYNSLAHTVPGLVKRREAHALPRP